MAKPPSPAQRAAQFTFALKGHIKNSRVAYIRAAVGLATARDEKIWRTLGHPSMEDYAWRRLRLRESTLYRYLHVHDWLKKSHPSWLAKRPPKGFIPELSDVLALEWIDKQLASRELDPALRTELESARRKALKGELSDGEFRALQQRGRNKAATLRSLLARTRALRRVAAGVANLPANALAAYDEAITAIAAALASTRRVAHLTGLRAHTLARLRERSRVVPDLGAP